MPKVTKEIIAKLKAAHSGTELHIISNPVIPDEEVVCRGPNRGEWAIFRQKSTSDTEKTTAFEVLLPCIVWPEPGELEKIMDRYPATAGVWAGEIAEIAGVSAKATHRKL